MEKFRTVKSKKHKAKHGFLKRSASHTGKKILANRRKQGRKKISA